MRWLHFALCVCVYISSGSAGGAAISGVGGVMCASQTSGAMLSMALPRKRMTVATKPTSFSDADTSGARSSAVKYS